MYRHFIQFFSRFAFLLYVTTAASLASAASNQAQIDNILKSDSAPFGVVFEVIEGDSNELDWIFPRIQQYASKLRSRFPDIGIAVVSHGKEEFGLLKNSQKKHKEVHKIVKSLKDDNIPVHVCGTHASWYDKKPEDFPEYINVSPAGPTEIQNYRDMGYQLVVIRK